MRHRRKTFIIIATLIIGISLVILLAIATTTLGPLLTGVKENTPEYEIAYVFQLQNYPDTEVTTKIDNDTILAVTTEPDGTSRYAIIEKDPEGNYTTEKNIISLGNSLSSLGFNTDIDGATLYEKGGKYIFYVPVQGYPFDNSDAAPTIDLSEVKIYDNTGNLLQHVDGKNFTLYYEVMESIPKGYKVFLEYEGKEYLLLDADERVTG